MISKFKTSIVQVWLLGLALVWLPNACSSKQEDTEEQVQEDDSQGGDDQGQDAKAADDTVDDAASDLATSEKEVPEQLSEDAQAAQQGNNDQVATADSAAAPGEAEQVAQPQAAPLPQAGSEPQVVPPPSAGGPVVMYVKSTKADVLSEASSGGSRVAQLEKGDHILIDNQGAFGKLSNNTFVAMKDLSTEVVGRKRAKNPWHHK